MNRHGEMNKREKKAAAREMDALDRVEQYKSIEGTKAEVLKQMEKWACRGWWLKAFGWSNGFQGCWYAVMTRELRSVYGEKPPGYWR